MAAIYCADIYCDDCADCIKRRVAVELWNEGPEAVLPDGVVLKDIEDCVILPDIHEYLQEMDERDYDSDEYPKYCSDNEESDIPQHCGSGAGCINSIEIYDGPDVGYCFGNALTSNGEDYVKKAVRNGNEFGVACIVWAVEYDYLDFEESDNDDN